MAGPNVRPVEARRAGNARNIVPRFSPYTPRQLRAALTTIGDAAYTVLAPLGVVAWRTDEPVPFAARETGERLELAPGAAWGRPFDAAWFRFTAVAPPGTDAAALVAVLDTGAELLVVDDRGEPVRGLTPARLTYEELEDRTAKSVLPLAGLLPTGVGVQADGPAEAARAGAAQAGATGAGPTRPAGELEVWADAGCNELFQDPAQRCTLRRADLAVVHPEVVALYYDYEVLAGLLEVLPPDSPRYHEVLAALTEAGRLLYKGLPDVAGQAREVLRPALERRGGEPVLRFSAIGHAHLDLAWLWPLREGVRKSVRTFATALATIDRYGDYVFAASQPQHYQWIKDDNPELYERVRAGVAAGRIEPLGALWVEADTNISGGEALVRQLLYGKRFLRNELDTDAVVAWLPDSFGFSGALPQLLRGAGVTYFTTQKLSWSLVNRFPHHSFVWRGIDGTRVLTHMLPEDEYNSAVTPKAVRKAETNYRDKDVSHYGLIAYGLGDGGGGPGEQHLERLARLRDLQGLSPVRQEAASAFYERWSAEADRFAEWVGELYLERHQGTLTTQARVKRFNRLMELGLRELEWVASLALVVAGAPYPEDWLGRAWREVLLYQFHDILPGSSIRRVYDEALPRYEALHAEVLDLLAEYDRRLAAAVDTAGLQAPFIVQNSLPWPRNDWVRLDQSWREVRTPAMGYSVVDAEAAGPPPARVFIEASPSLLENDVLRVAFAPDGSIASLIDKRLGRDLITPGGAGNVLAVYADDGDVWDFPTDYRDQEPHRPELVSAEARADGSRGVVRQTYRLGRSEIAQDVALMANGARLDFFTTVRWREPRTMLRTSFAVTPRAEEATFEIQFGHIRRPTHFNTSWDAARTEVAAHKWADLSQGDYGVALLNDCKYGHRIKDGVIDLNLLRSVAYPGAAVPPGEEQASDDPNPHFTDQADHRFRYALYPHPGDHVAGRVVQAAYEMNVPLRATRLGAARRPETAGGSRAEPHPPAAPLLEPAGSFLELDTPSIVVEAVKRAEEGGDLILRLYEADRRGTVAALTFGFDVAGAAEVDLLEEQPTPLQVQNGRQLRLEFRPFEIKTLRVTPARA